MRQAEEYPGLLSISNSFYRALLFLYPRQFRTHYGLDMVRTFNDCSRDALLGQGAAGLLWVWVAHLFDLGKTIFEQHILERKMNKSTLQTTVVGGILAGVGLLILASQFSNFSLNTWAWVLAAMGAITGALFLRDRSQRWLMFTSYVLWVLTGVMYLVNLGEAPNAGVIIITQGQIGTDDLIAPFVLSAIAIPFWIGYFNTKKGGFLAAAYSLSVLVLVITTALFSSGDFITVIVTYAVAGPWLVSYFTEENHSLLVPGYLLFAFGTSFGIGMGLELYLNADEMFTTGLGGGLIVFGLGLQALRPLIRKATPHATAQTLVIGAIMIVIGGIALYDGIYDIQVGPSTQNAYLILVGIGVVTGVLYLLDRTQTWLLKTSYVMFVLTAVAVFAIDTNDRIESSYIAPLILGSIALPYLISFFRDPSKQGALIIGYVFSAITGLLLIIFSNIVRGNFIAPYIMFAIGLPFLYAYLRNQVRWALLPGYAMSALGFALLLGRIVQDATSLENAFEYSAAGVLLLAALGMQALRPMLREQPKTA